MPPILPRPFEPSAPPTHRRAKSVTDEPSLEAEAGEGWQMRPRYSQHLIAQAGRVAQLLGIAQIRKVLPQLTPYLGEAAPLDRLRGHRDQLWSLRRQALGLAATIRRDLRELEEELQAASVDTLLGLRR